MPKFIRFLCQAISTAIVTASFLSNVSFSQDTKLERHTRKHPADAAELAAIAERGRMIAVYDQIAWHATDAVQALHPPSGSVEMYIGRETKTGWVVAFGKLNQTKDAFLFAYEVKSLPDAPNPQVLVNSPALEEHGEWLTIARALDSARTNFGPQSRPYNSAVLPAPSGGWYVYFYPGTTSTDVFPTGADVRFHVSLDGKAVIDKRVMHASYLEFPKPKDGTDAGMWFRTAFLDDVPEDTDAANSIMMGGRVGIVACPTFVYQIAADGSITYMKKTETFMKDLKKQD